MSVGNYIIDVSRDLIISVGHNITYLKYKILSRLSHLINRIIQSLYYAPAGR